jgi:hypothetical protein
MPVAFAKVPTGQKEQEFDPSVAYVPVVHVVPHRVPVLPAGHKVQNAAAVADVFPLGQLAHVDSPSELYVPALQSAHISPPVVALILPGGHASQVTVPCADAM